MRKNKKNLAVFISIALSFMMAACGNGNASGTQAENSKTTVASENVTIEDVPEYSGSPYVEINNNEPEFSEEEMTTEEYEDYGELDSLGRCDVTESCIGTDIMPEEERGAIGMIKPTGWHTVKYDNVDGKYLYNRCHLIGFQLAGENANEKNLITGTRYMNVEGMLPFENEVADYVKDTDNHVMYRVTPVYEEDNLVASGVQIEAESVEDDGKGVQFNVYCYNVQPGIEINYATGESWEADSEAAAADEKENTDDASSTEYIINKNTGKFHKPDCSSVEDIKPQNKKEFTGSREDVTELGYEPCGRCKP